MKKEKVKIDLKKFIAFHNKRLELLNDFLLIKKHGRLIFQISFLGFESLAKLLFQDENNSGKRFISLLSLPNVGVPTKNAEDLYNFWRNSLIHQGFITYPWTTLESWEENDDSFLIFEDKMRGSTEYHPGSIVLLYKNLIKYFETYFKDELFLSL
ncbi:MAG: hypothetical protein NUV46_03745 [Nanoarchaeota archaeon]|nr:hypothetical protein [Nanoarchaeota archaeon]